ncbi:uncharacterized protein F5147DRAFT_649315 [Suillus discolor]|uniref:Uncharacterized protein n=1 Tax=Suillus discolor TaxID=1912936 RepID=A0A9P7FEE3_9AGAM|nr:uncharacterized protein F5147DRAFT_649315 [Suillus discolor]KAG2115896.1 hypothetical protein F5147DRAFT_649315 [Suillus discolor]
MEHIACAYRSGNIGYEAISISLADKDEFPMLSGGRITMNSRQNRVGRWNRNRRLGLWKQIPDATRIEIVDWAEGNEFQMKSGGPIRMKGRCNQQIPNAVRWADGIETIGWAHGNDLPMLSGGPRVLNGQCNQVGRMEWTPDEVVWADEEHHIILSGWNRDMTINIHIFHILWPGCPHKVVKAIVHEPCPHDAITGTCDSMPDKVSRASNNGARLISQLYTEVGQGHQPITIVADTGHDVEPFGSRSWISVKRALPVTNDGCAVEDQGPKLQTSVYVIVTVVHGPPSEFYMRGNRGPIQLWMHHPKSRRGQEC